MRTCKMPLDAMNPVAYNPRKDLQPSDPEYKALLRSMEEFGYVEPIIFNRQTGNIVGGHQRYKVLRDMGKEEAECVVVDLDEVNEKILNVALNKLSGRWDYDRLSDLLTEIKEAGGLEFTGFEEYELEALKAEYNHIDDLMAEDFSDTGKGELSAYTMTFTLPAEVREAVERYVAKTPNGKTELATAIVNKARGLSE